MNESKHLKHLLAEANELANLDAADDTGITLDEALNDLIAAHAQAKEKRFCYYRVATLSRRAFLEQIEQAFPDSAEARCLVALKVCTKYGGLSEGELSALAEEYPEILALLAREGYPVQEGEREDAHTCYLRKPQNRMVWMDYELSDFGEGDNPAPRNLRWVRTKIYSIA